MSGVRERAGKRHDWAGLVGKILVCLGWLNFIAFVCVAYWIGGDAMNGKVENGRYFLGDRGSFIEVSAAVYWYSWVHLVSVFATHLLGMLGIFLWSYSLQKRPQA